jgi:hypothetical protein
MESSGAGQAPFVTICDGPLKFIRRCDNTERIILVNPSTARWCADVCKFLLVDVVAHRHRKRPGCKICTDHFPVVEAQVCCN